MQFSYRLYMVGSDKLLAICDREILGKTFQEEELCIEVSDFYSDKACDEKGAAQLLESATVVNAVGRNIINVMVKNKFIEEGNILYIKGVPHAQTISMV